MTSGVVRSLWFYPVKGLSPQQLDEVHLEPGTGFPMDRRWALSRVRGTYRAGTPIATPKSEFHVLVKDERLAGLRTRVHDGSLLTVEVQGHEVLTADLDDDLGRAEISTFFGRVLDLDAEELPVVASEPGRRFTDVSVVSDGLMNAISFINLESVREFERRIGARVDPLRFRANVYYDGLPPFSELELVGSTISVGDAVIEAVLNTRRCAATEVNPMDARRDLPVPRLLMQSFGHSDMGVYGEVRNGGRVGVGSAVWHDREENG